MFLIDYKNRVKVKLKIETRMIFLSAFQFVADWWGRQPGRRAVGGGTPPTKKLHRQFEMRPFLYIKKSLFIEDKSFPKK